MRAQETLYHNSKLCKTLKYFWGNLSGTKYHQCILQARILRNDFHVSKFCTKPYEQYIPHGKAMHGTDHTNP